MIEVELQLDVVAGDGGNDLLRMVKPGEVVPGYVAVIQRFDQNVDVEATGFFRCMAQIVDKAGVAGFPFLGPKPRHDMDTWAGELRCIVERLPERRAEISLAARLGGKPALAAAPVAGRRVEEHQLDVGRSDPRLEFRCRPVVREQDFDPAKSCGTYALRTLRKRFIREEHGHIGG